MRRSVGASAAAILGALLVAACRENVYLGAIDHRDAAMETTPGGPISFDAADELSADVADTGRVFSYLHARGAKIVDESESEVRLRCVNWSGFETHLRAPDGLHARTVDALVSQVATLGFNCIRLPYCNAALRDDSIPSRVDAGVSPVAANPELFGQSSRAILDKIIVDAEAHGLYVILARHAPAEDLVRYPLWAADPDIDAEWSIDWQSLARYSLGHTNLVGFDLHDEPGGTSTWGAGSPTDWDAAAKRVGDQVLAINPHLLVLVAGIENADAESYWPGGNLLSVHNHGIVLADPRQLVYSAHDYGSGRMAQPWFAADASYPGNLPAVWDHFWGWVMKDDSAPVFVGAFGDRGDADLVSPAEAETDAKWLGALVSYLNLNAMSFGYWALNPSAQGLTGILRPGWQEVNPGQRDRIMPLLP